MGKRGEVTLASPNQGVEPLRLQQGEPWELTLRVEDLDLRTRAGREPSPDMETVRRFSEAVYGQASGLLACSRTERDPVQFQPANQPPASARVILSTYRTDQVAEKGRPRGTDNLEAVTALQLDIDTRRHAVGKGITGDKLLDYPTDQETLEAIAHMPLAVSVLTCTRGGFHATWAADEPRDLREPGAVQAASDLEARWSQLLRNHLETVCRRRVPRGVDTLRLTSVLRVPGYWQESYGGGWHPLRIVFAHPSRQPWSEFEEWTKGIEVPGNLIRAEFTGELPKELAPHIAFATQALGVRDYVRKDGAGSGISTIRLTACPACGKKEKAYVTPLAGTLHCWRASCAAHAGGAGVPFEEWTREYLSTEQLAELARMGRKAEPEVLVAIDPDWPEISIDHVSDQVAVWISESAANGHESLTIGVLPTASGKTHGMALAALKDPGGLAYFFKDHTKASAFVTMLHGAAKEMGVEVPDVVYRKGVKLGCKYSDALQDCNGYDLVKRSLCGGCELHMRCDSTRQPKPHELLISVVDAFDSLAGERIPALDPKTPGEKRALLDGRAIVVDEAPDEDVVTVVKIEALERVHYNRENYARVGTPRGINPVHAASMFGLGIMELAIAARRAEPVAYGQSWSGEALREMILALHGGQNLLDATQALSSIETKCLPRLSLPELEEGRYQSSEDLPHTYAVETAWRALCPLALDDPKERAKQERSDGRRAFLVCVGDRVTLEVHARRVWGVGGGAGTLILSATGALHKERVRAANPHLDVRVVGARVRPVEGSKLVRVFSLSTSVSRMSLLDKGWPRLQHGEESPTKAEGTAGSAMCQVWPVLERELPPDRYQAVRKHHGLIGFRVIVDALKDSAELREHFEEKADLAPEEMGYFGLDETASNAFENLAGLMLYGSHVPNLGAISRKALALGLELDPLLAAIVGECYIQAEGRLRHLRRDVPVAIWVVRDKPPAHWEPGSYFVAEPGARAVGAVTKPRKTLADALVRVARTTGEPLSAWVVGRMLEPAFPGSPGPVSNSAVLLLLLLSIGARRYSPQAVREAVGQAGRALSSEDGWEVHRVSAGGRGRPWTVHAAPGWTDAQAATWATTQRAEHFRAIEQRYVALLAVAMHWQTAAPAHELLNGNVGAAMVDTIPAALGAAVLVLLEERRRRIVHRALQLMECGSVEVMEEHPGQIPLPLTRLRALTRPGLALASYAVDLQGGSLEPTGTGP